MKKLYLIPVFILINVNILISQTWVPVGDLSTTDVGIQGTYSLEFDINNNNNPIIAYSSKFNSDKLSVIEYNSSLDIWENIGNQTLTNSGVNYVNIKVAPDNSIYVAFSETSNNDKLTLIKYDGNSWLTISQELSIGRAINIDMEINNSDNLFLTYQDEGLGNSIMVKKYNTTNNSFNTIADENEPLFNNGTKPKMAIDNSNNIPYVAFISGNDKAIVISYVSNWTQIGDSFSYIDVSNNNLSSIVQELDITFLSNNSLFVGTSQHRSGFQEYRNYFFETSTWNENGGNERGGIVKTVSDNQGNPFVFYMFLSGFDNRVEVESFTNNNWEQVGNGSDIIPLSSMKFASIALDNNNIPYVLYSSYGDTAAIKSLNQNLSVNDFNLSNISLSPNPTSDKVTIKNMKESTNYKIYNLIGQNIFEGELSTGNSIDFSHFKNGVYILKLKNSKTFKIIKR